MIDGELRSDRNGLAAAAIVRAWMAMDPQELAEEGTRILYEDHVERARAGLDVRERPMPETLRERGIGGKWRTINGRPVLVERDENPPAGPPLLPHGEASRFITLAEVRVDVRTEGEFSVYASQLGWPDFVSESGDWIPGFHARPEPGAHYPRRDMVTEVTEAAAERWGEAYHDWMRAIRDRGNT